MKQTRKENLAEVGFEPTTSGLQVQCFTKKEQDCAQSGFKQF